MLAMGLCLLWYGYADISAAAKVTKAPSYSSNKALVRLFVFEIPGK